MYFDNGWQITFDGETVFSTYKKATKKPDNKAPKSIKGDYDPSIYGNKIVLVDNIDGTTVETKCHPDDNFDIGLGIKEAFKKLNEKREENNIKVGDWVEIVNPGTGSYPGNAEYFKQNQVKKYAPYFRFGVVPEKGTVGKVVYMEKYPNATSSLYIIQEVKSKCYGEKDYNELTYSNGIYLVNEHGIKKVAKPDV